MDTNRCVCFLPFYFFFKFSVNLCVEHRYEHTTVQTFICWVFVWLPITCVHIFYIYVGTRGGRPFIREITVGTTMVLTIFVKEGKTDKPSALIRRTLNGGEIYTWNLHFGFGHEVRKKNPSSSTVHPVFNDRLPYNSYDFPSLTFFFGSRTNYIPGRL